MIYEQGSPEWFAERAGKITASRMNDVMSLPEDGVFKSGPRKGQPYPMPRARVNYQISIAAERLTGRLKKAIEVAPLAWGKDVEPVARAAYEARTGVLVQQVGFLTHPEYPFIGASADFLVGQDGGGEIKCPESIDVHLLTLEEGLPEEHINQIQGGLFVSRRKWWDFCSFHPYYKSAKRLYVQRIERDDAYIAKLEAACLSLETAVREIVARHES